MPPRDDDKLLLHQEEVQQSSDGSSDSEPAVKNKKDSATACGGPHLGKNIHGETYPLPEPAASSCLTPVTSNGPGAWRRQTFHHELNIISAVVLAAIYTTCDMIPMLIWKIGAALICVDAARYYYYKGNMAGVPYTLPCVALIGMIVHPNRFWEELATRAMNSKTGMACNQLASNMMIFVTDPQACKISMTNMTDYGVYAHPNAGWLFGKKNLIYLEPVRHKKFRAILTPALFSKEALVQFGAAQEAVVRKYLEQYATTRSIELMTDFRSMAAASSQESFLGPYLSDEDREHLERDILTFTMGFLCFPFPYLNSGLHKAIQAKNRIEHTIRKIVPQAREYINSGKPPRCMMEHWSAAIIAAAKEQGVDHHPQDVDCCHDDDMARTVLDFLFAAQDATTSALTYALDVLEANRHVWEKMRKEVRAECGNKNGGVNTVMMQEKSLAYTRKVANQLLHHKPPVPMIPHITNNATYLNGHYLGAGTVVCPSITYSARVSGRALEFLPDRPDQDALFVETHTFGCGQHKCPGRRYAESLVVVFLAVLAMDYDFERVAKKRPTADEFIYFPTIFPVDSEFVIQKVTV